MRIGAYDIVLLVNGKPMQEFVDPSSGAVYVIAEPGISLLNSIALKLI